MSRRRLPLFKGSPVGKWTRRGFISAGVIAGGGLVVGVAIRPGNRASQLAKHVTADGETLLHTWVKLDSNNVVTAIVPHSEMGQGAGTALAQMLADELNADWNLIRFEEAPALGEFANHPLTKGMLLADVDMPDSPVDRWYTLYLKVDALRMLCARARAIGQGDRAHRLSAWQPARLRHADPIVPMRDVAACKNSEVLRV